MATASMEGKRPQTPPKQQQQQQAQPLSLEDKKLQLILSVDKLLAEHPEEVLWAQNALLELEADACSYILDLPEDRRRRTVRDLGRWRRAELGALGITSAEGNAGGRAPGNAAGKAGGNAGRKAAGSAAGGAAGNAACATAGRAAGATASIAAGHAAGATQHRATKTAKATKTSKTKKTAQTTKASKTPIVRRFEALVAAFRRQAQHWMLPGSWRYQKLAKQD